MVNALEVDIKEITMRAVFARITQKLHIGSQKRPLIEILRVTETSKNLTQIGILRG